MPPHSYGVAVDVGGTYTDCVVVDADGARTACKALTTPEDRTLGVLDSLRSVAAELGVGGLAELLRATGRFVHGSTVATNVMVERRGAPTALLTTRGHEDAIFIGRGRQRVAGLSESQITHVTHHRKPAPLVAHSHTVGLIERVDAAGEVLVPLRPDDVRNALRTLADEGIRAMAVCLLWSIANPAHERMVREIVQQEFPDQFYLTLSSDVAPVLGEYERLTSTVINAYIGPAITSYTTRLETELREAGLQVPVLFTQANGGLAASDYVQERPIVMLDSGPAAGVLGVAAFASSIAQPNILCADVGGTTFDVGMVTSSRPEQDEFPVIDQFEFRLPKVLIKSIGAGGGSIAWLDSRESLRVGPQSAGAVPGPACYGRGGTEPTVTDAYLVLGYLDPGLPLASGVALDVSAAERAIAKIADRLGWKLDQTAAAIVWISGNQMGDLLHRITLERGLDPRDFALAIYGGAGPLYAAAISHAVGIPVVHVMPEAGSFSALGMLSSDLVSSATASVVEPLPLSPPAKERLEEESSRLTKDVRDFFDRQNVGEGGLELRTAVGMRFALQAHHLNVSANDLPESGPEEASAELARRFLARYEDLYGENSVFAASPVETVNVTVAGISHSDDNVLFAVNRATGTTIRPIGQRRVHFHGHGWVATDVYHFESLDHGDVVTGPAVIHRSGDTIAVPPKWSITGGGRGDLVLRSGEGERA